MDKNGEQDKQKVWDSTVFRERHNLPFLKLELEGSKWGWRSKKEPHHVSQGVFIWNAFHSEWELSAEGLEDLKDLKG